MPRRPHDHISHKREGRPLAITPQGRDRLLGAIRAGVPARYAAEVAGIGTRTLQRYMTRGEQAEINRENGEPITADDETLRLLWLDVLRARAEAAARGVAVIQKVGAGGYVIKETTRSYRDPVSGKVITETEKQFAPPDAKPVQWLLERTYREEFGRSSAVEVTGAGGGPVQAETSVVVALADRVAALAIERRQEDELAADDVADGGVVVDVEVS